MSKLSVRKFGVGVASLALVAGVSPAFGATGDLPSGPGATPSSDVDRLSGKDRFETALKVALSEHSAATTIYLVGANALVDAASAGSLNKATLVVPNDAAAQEAFGETIQNKFTSATKLVAVGGTGVVSDDAIKNIRKNATRITTVDRINGANRYETSVNVAKEAYTKSQVKHIYLTRGDMVVDALAAGAITDGPVLLVNKEGTVDKSLVDYYKYLEKSPSDVVVLGGTGALSDAQVQQIIGEDAKIDPWKNIVSEATLKDNIRTAAALYFGQGQWQHYAAGEDTYFGLNVTAVTGISTDPSKIKITTPGIQAAADVFMGYKPASDFFANFKLSADVAVTNSKAALTKAVNAVTGSTATGATRADIQGVGSGVTTDGDKFVQTFRALYGFAPDTPSGACYVKYDGTAATAKITGLDTAAIAEKVARDKKDAAVIALAKNDMNVPDANTSANVIASDQSAQAKNFVAIAELVSEYAATTGKQATDAKKVLDDAVEAYTKRDTLTVATGGSTTVKRITGADRYETAALLSAWTTAGGQAISITKTKVYLASGNDANLVDAMVAGQLTNGPILLVPGTGELPKSTASELRRLGLLATKPAVQVIGGKSAVSEEIAKLAVAAVKDAK